MILTGNQNLDLAIIAAITIISCTGFFAYAIVKVARTIAEIILATAEEK